MAKGGHARSGRVPDPEALRRDRDEGEWTVLPAEGREGDPPEWPLSEQSHREAELWTVLWAKPQAIVWERLGQQIEVALFVRNVARAEQPGSPVNLGTLVRQQSDSLGLTTPGMRANRWKVDRGGQVQEKPAPARRGRSPRSATPARERALTVIDGGAGA
jgi:hypothetical protein